MEDGLGWRPAWSKSIELLPAAALDPNAGSGIHFQPNPLVESADMAQGQGLRLVC